MTNSKRDFIPNQVFVGLPWKNVRPKYDRIIQRLERTYPVHFTIVGKNDGQDAQDLFEIIKKRIASSSYAIFDATGGNANVSLEYGYAEGIEVPKSIFLSAHKSSQRGPSSSPIISDLHGQRRVQYKTEKSLSLELHKLCREHPYTKRFEKSLTRILKNKRGGAKRKGRTFALRVIRALDERSNLRRAELVQALQVHGYKNTEIEDMLKKLNSAGVVKSTVGRHANAYVA